MPPSVFDAAIQYHFRPIFISVSGGSPAFTPMHIESMNLLDEIADCEPGFGLLRLDGSQTFLTLDGFDRVQAIRQAIRLDPSLRQKQIPVTFIKHEHTPEGIERIRQLIIGIQHDNILE